MWTSHPDLELIIKNSWNKNSDITYVISLFTKEVLEWNRKTFESIFKQKRTLPKRLEGIQNSQHYLTSSYLQQLEKELTKKFNNILQREEDFWTLKSRIN